MSVRNYLRQASVQFTPNEATRLRNMTPDAHHQSVPSLDERLYKLDRAFFKQQTGIEDNDELKTHLLSIQAEAYEVTHFWGYLTLF